MHHIVVVFGLQPTPDQRTAHCCCCCQQTAQRRGMSHWLQSDRPVPYKHAVHSGDGFRSAWKRETILQKRMQSMLTNRREQQATVPCFHHHYSRRRSRSTTCLDAIGRHGPSRRRQGGGFDRVVSLDGNTDIDASKADPSLLLPMPINSLSGAACFSLLLQNLLQLAMSSKSASLPFSSSCVLLLLLFCCCCSCCCCCCCGGVVVSLACEKEKDLAENYQHSVREKPALTNHNGCCGSTMKPSVKVSLQLLLALYRFRPRSSFPSLLPPLRL
jgi:hypothetical protein